jgi:multidrug resistance efflux pump
MMDRLLKWLLPALAVAGLAYAIFFTTVLAQRPVPPPNQLMLPAESAYASTVSGSGLIEASSRNIAIGSFLPGIVAEVPVIEGQWVQRGDVLFVVDRRTAEAELAITEREITTAERAVTEASAELVRAEAALKAIAVRRDAAQRELARLQRLVAGNAAPQAQLDEERDRLSTAEADLDLQRAAIGAARARLASAQVAVAAAQAREMAAQVTLDKLTVRAPIDGRILKVTVRPGQFVEAGIMVNAAVLMGNDALMHVRAQIDENDLWRFKPGAAAEAVVRGNTSIRFPISFVRVEPYVEPKRSLTGDTTERIDTRVLEVIYAFDPKGLNVYIGQQVDVFVAAAAAGG